MSTRPSFATSVSLAISMPHEVHRLSCEGVRPEMLASRTSTSLVSAASKVAQLEYGSHAFSSPANETSPTRVLASDVRFWTRYRRT